MKTLTRAALAVLAALFLLTPSSVPAPEPVAGEVPAVPGDDLFADAEHDYAEGSFSRANERYRALGELDLSADQVRWVEFRLADTQWRARSSTASADPTLLEEARASLEAMVRDRPRADERDRIWAEVQESLADFWWTRRQARNWGPAWSYYQAALDWWAGSSELELARGRYLAMVRRIAEPPGVEPYYSYGYYGNFLPLPILENTLKIASSSEDEAHAHYLLAMTLRQQAGDGRQLHRVPAEFEAALAAGRGTSWYDDALFHLATWWAQRGQVKFQENGGWTQNPDYVQAVVLFRRLLAEYQKGETRYHDQARSTLENITRPVVGLSVSNIFLPGSEIEYHLNWRNAARIDLALYRVDLLRDVSLPGDARAGSWLQHLSLGGRERHASWSFETGDEGQHRPGRDALVLEQELELGAYVLVAFAEGQTARELILVSDASLVLKASGKSVLLYACDVLGGAPLPGAQVKLWERVERNSRWAWKEHSGEVDGDGLALFDVSQGSERRAYRELFAVVTDGARQAFAIGTSVRRNRDGGRWRIQAFTDRSAYRPGETAHWKLVARRHDGSVYSTPTSATLSYEITDPRGTKIDEGEVRLNEFGSAWGSLELTVSMPLGQYRVQFWTEGRKLQIGGAALLRLEEYKLPEFRVSIEMPEVDGKKATFRLGDTVEVGVQAEYYFGGPVANAEVEILVHQNPMAHYWSPPRPYPWFYEDMSVRSGWGYRSGQIIKRETVRTDEFGKAVLRFETPANLGHDVEYRVEARVTDASRREVVGSDTVRVGRQGYYVYPRPRHSLYRPQDQVTIDFKSLDPNEQPVPVAGVVTVTRDRYVEIWIDPQGREIRGRALDRLRDSSSTFPPTSSPGDASWRLKFQGYEHEAVLTRTVKTDAEGEAEFEFVPQSEGYYRIAWRSEDDGYPPVIAETTVWVATHRTSDLGYRHGGVEIIADRDTFQVGQKTPIMLVASTQDRYILFTVEGEDLYSYQLVHMSGRVKLIELDIGEQHVPNIFLSATMISDRDVFQDTEQIVVPPVRHFLDVEVEYDRDSYEPRHTGTVTVRIRDHEGRPVAAQVALGLADESVYAIQADQVLDPRQFFFGTKRTLEVQTSTTLQQKRYRKLIFGEDNKLQDDETLSASGILGGGEREMREEAVGRHAQLSLGRASGQVAMKSSLEASSMADMAAAPMESDAPASGGAVQVRSDFRSTMFWQPDVMTGSDGTATVEVIFPDSLTTWRATARAVSRGQQFGVSTASAKTRKPLIVRLQAPRFFVVGDHLTVSALVNNNTSDALAVKPSLTAEGLVVRGAPGEVSVPAHGETRVDWQVQVQKAGVATLTVVARGSRHEDAMRREFQVHEHGIEKFLSRSGKVCGDEVVVTLELPAQRRDGSTRMMVQIAPSLAVTMLDALPYLIDYPYGCTEQTMSRFLPAAIVVGTLEGLGLAPETLEGRLFGGIEPEHVAQSQPKGKKDLRQLDRMIREGLHRLYDFQHADGGWGWWKEGESDHYMTAYVLWGLSLAHQGGLDVRRGVADRAARFLELEIVEEENHDDMASWMLHALAVYHGERAGSSPADSTVRAFDNLWEHRTKLNAYTRALLALSAQALGASDRAQTLVRNLENGVTIDKTPDTSVVQRGVSRSQASVISTAHWGNDGFYRRWSDGAVEATAFALRALLAIHPDHELVQLSAQWLIKNRRGAQWSNTRDTAIVVLALNDYLRVSGELESEVDYELLINGHSLVRRSLGAGDALSAASRFSVPVGWIQDGKNQIRILRHAGSGSLYFSAEATFFSLEEPVTPAGNEIFVRRQYAKLVPRPTLLKGVSYEKVPLEDGDSVRSGERVEVVLTIEAKSDVEYVILEDLKPAGFEAVQVRSGEPLYARELKSGAVQRTFGQADGTGPVEPTDLTGRSRRVYQELRDRKVALFLDKLPQGVWEIRYDLRAEVPGTFHGLPVLGHAMYVPEIRCNGQEIRITVLDR